MTRDLASGCAASLRKTSVQVVAVAFQEDRAPIREHEPDQEARMTTRRTYTVPEVAEMLGISRSTAYECVRRGEIPSLKLVVIPRTAFEAFLGEHTPPPTTAAPRTRLP
jgi:excisionase family DNA binding protein